MVMLYVIDRDSIRDDVVIAFNNCLYLLQSIKFIYPKKNSHAKVIGMDLNGYF